MPIKYSSRGVLWTPLVFFIGILWQSCSNNEEEVNALNAGKSNALIEQFEVNLVYSDSGQAKIRLKAGRWEDFTDQRDAPFQRFSEGIDVEILDQEGNLSGLMRAQKAIQFAQTDTWEITGHVEIVQEDGQALYTNGLLWRRKEHTFLSLSDTTYVRIVDHGSEIFGRGFKAEEDISSYTIYSVSGELDVNDR